MSYLLQNTSHSIKEPYMDILTSLMSHVIDIYIYIAYKKIHDDIKLF